MRSDGVCRRARPALLSKRLKELEASGVILRASTDAGTRTP